MTRLPKPLAYVAVILFVCLSASHISAQEIRLKDSEHIQTKAIFQRLGRKYSVYDFRI